MTTRSSFEGQQRHSGADLPNTSSSYAGSSGRQSDDSAFYAFGDDWDKPPKMSSALAQFLHEKAAVPMEFINDFEQAALVWNMKSFMKWFSMGTTSDVAKRFGTDFCMKYPIQIARISVLNQFLREHPLAISETDPNTPNYQSFDREEWWSFLQENRRDIKAEWDDAFDQLFQEATERITNRSSVAQPEFQVPLPRTPVSIHPNPPPLTYSTGAGFATREVMINRSPLVSEFVTREVNINRSPPVSDFVTRDVNINRSPPVSDFATRERLLIDHLWSRKSKPKRYIPHQHFHPFPITLRASWTASNAGKSKKATIDMMNLPKLKGVSYRPRSGLGMEIGRLSQC